MEREEMGTKLMKISWTIPATIYLGASACQQGGTSFIISFNPPKKKSQERERYYPSPVAGNKHGEVKKTV